jgi:hypothetical protein
VFNKPVKIVMHLQDSYRYEFFGIVETWFASWRARFKLLSTALSILFQKLDIGRGSKIDTYF